MYLNPRILGLPATLLLLIASPTNAQVGDENLPAQWPYNLPPHVRVWPEDPPNRRRNLEAVDEHLRLGRSPVGVIKMSGDEGEKFYMEYWQFDGDQSTVLDRTAFGTPLRLRDSEEAMLLVNNSMPMPFRPPFALHTSDRSDPVLDQDLRARSTWQRKAAAPLALSKKDFTCPTGTSNCSVIGYPNSCCAIGETCYSVEDTVLGPVGCCPSDGDCVGTVTTCDAPNTACPDNLGGGCCIPNYICEDAGC